MNRTLSVSEWHELSKEGNMIPVRIRLSGYSMNPLIRGYRDYVTVVPIDGILSKGDIVLFCEPGTNRYVMHRVWDIQNGKIQIWGDNCKTPDGWFDPEDIWGKAILIERGKHRICPDPEKGIRWARFWHKAGKAYRLCRRYKRGILRRIKKQSADE